MTLAQASRPPRIDGSARSISDAEFANLRDLIAKEAGISLSETKRQLVSSRLARRLRERGFTSYQQYYEYVRDDDPTGDELERMINCITTNKTDFYREPHHFEFLRRVFAEAPAGPIRIWSAGCSSGEEPYTIAMAARDHFGAAADRVTIHATDIDTEVLARARRGVYPEDRLRDVPEATKRRHFLRGRGTASGSYRVRPELMAMVTFRQLNFIDAAWDVAPGFDLIFCRNVIIYFNRPTQERLMHRFAGVLQPRGHLILGHSENLHWLTDTFEPLGQTVYRLRSVSTGRIEPRRPRAPAAPAPNRIIAGGVFAGSGNAEVRTILGSCVAACLYDPVAGIGGMNHFMLPTGSGTDDDSARYGVHAMELLINEIMRLGGDRRRLRAKLFGGGRVLQIESNVGRVAEKNIEFAKRFLQVEAIPIEAQRLGGSTGVEVRFLVGTGRALVRAVHSEQVRAAAIGEQRYEVEIARRFGQPRPDNVVLF